MTTLTPIEYAQHECSICYDELGTTNTCTTPCGHEFCFKCMMEALNHNNTCPCCRSTLKEEVVVEDEESDDEWDPNDDNINYWRRGTNYLQSMSNDDRVATPEVLAKKIQAAGYTMEDLVAIWSERIDRSNDRYKDNNFVKKMVSDIENMVDIEDQEVDDRESEMEFMGQEDHRQIEIESRDIFDRFPELDLTNLFNM